ncbi:hypothetical protein RC62_4602 [Flavobacterium aquidurense]|uniref:Uncharacterized protein n=1 Tax=Flavobacterium aquidurense TaxID=362413 RepID=A0A0Q0S6M4_9FLAO|nr:hypothetical protein RC62_4602 [Flavobacterium aquidurense]
MDLGANPAQEPERANWRSNPLQPFVPPEASGPAQKDFHFYRGEKQMLMKLFAS